MTENLWWVAPALLAYLLSIGPMIGVLACWFGWDIAHDPENKDCGKVSGCHDGMYYTIRCNGCDHRFTATVWASVWPLTVVFYGAFQSIKATWRTIVRAALMFAPPEMKREAPHD